MEKQREAQVKKAWDRQCGSVIEDGCQGVLVGGRLGEGEEGREGKGKGGLR